MSYLYPINVITKIESKHYQTLDYRFQVDSNYRLYIYSNPVFFRAIDKILCNNISFVGSLFIALILVVGLYFSSFFIFSNPRYI